MTRADELFLEVEQSLEDWEARWAAVERELATANRAKRRERGYQRKARALELARLALGRTRTWLELAKQQGTGIPSMELQAAYTEFTLAHLRLKAAMPADLLRRDAH